MFAKATFGISRAVGRLSRRAGLGAGSSIPGAVATRLHRKSLESLSHGRRVVLVSGTNGKTTVTALIVAALRDPLLKDVAVATNAAGSNLESGLVTALLSTGSAMAVLEVDEVVLPRAIRAGAPAVVALLNLSRDQLDRTSEVSTHASRWGPALAGTEALIVANADDPLVVHAVNEGRPTGEAVEWVGVGQPWQADCVVCPSCHGLWQPRADWHCENCGLRRPFARWQLVDGHLVSPAGTRLVLDTSLPGRSNAANAAIAVVVAAALGVEPSVAISRTKAISSVAGRYGISAVAGVRLRLLLAKNPAGWAETLDQLAGGDQAVIVSVNARTADGLDPSWLWDVPFELLAGRQVVITGDRALDVATRLRYADVAHTRVPDLRSAIEEVAGTGADVVANYTAFSDAAALLAARGVRVNPATGHSGHAASPALPKPDAARFRAVTSRPDAVQIICVLPQLLGTYGDSGNAIVAQRRLSWRGIPAQVTWTTAADPLPRLGDLYLLGGGEDWAQEAALSLLLGVSNSWLLQGTAPVLAVCAGLQILGTSLPHPQAGQRRGLGLTDITTHVGTDRVLGEVVSLSCLGPEVHHLTGFANHAGRTALGPGLRPLATVLHGPGNQGIDDTLEGVQDGALIGTYLHGPVLARNPDLADHLLARVLGRELPPLPPGPEHQLQRERLGGRLRAQKP